MYCPCFPLFCLFIAWLTVKSQYYSAYATHVNKTDLHNAVLISISLGHFPHISRLPLRRLSDVVGIGFRSRWVYSVSCDTSIRLCYNGFPHLFDNLRKLAVTRHTRDINIEVRSLESSQINCSSNRKLRTFRFWQQNDA